MSQILTNMLTERNKDLFLRDDMLHAYLKTLLVLLYRFAYYNNNCGNIDTLAKSARENENVDRALQYVADNIHLRLSVAYVAKAINISISYMSSLFRKHLGMSPSRYISRAKLNEARRMIRDEQLSAKSIVAMLGYTTIQHFSRCFKTEFDITPSAYANAVKRGYKGK